MKYFETEIPDVKVIEPDVYGDERGFFMETFRQSEFEEQCCRVSFVQDNHSRSNQGILRGLHYQVKQPQGKLVRVISGEVFDVAVDLRKSSRTYGKWVGVFLSEHNKRQLWVPEGFAHGFYVTSESAEFVYKCTNYYSPENERSILWNCPEIGIEWPLVNDVLPTLSAKDQDGKNLSQADTY